MIGGPAIGRAGGAMRGLDVDGADHLLAQHLGAAVTRLGGAALAVIDLPAIQGGSPGKAELLAAAAIAWAREVEATGLLEVCDAIARDVATGALAVDADDATLGHLIEHHRGRDQRLGPDERRALYEHVLGDTNDDLAALVAALCEIGRAPPSGSVLAFSTRARVAGAALAAALAARATGIAGFAARDIAAQVRDALDLLGAPALARALGGGGVWAIVARQRSEPVDAGRAAARATAIRTIIAWLAEHAAQLARGRLVIDHDDPVVDAALTWSAEAR